MQEQIEAYEKALKYYQSANGSDPVLLPLDKHQFEALLSVAGSKFNLELNDLLRQCLAGYVHHIENNIHTTTVDDVSKILFKSAANTFTYFYDQEIKARMKQAAETEKIEADLKRRIASEAEKKAKKEKKADPKYLK